MLSSTDFLEIVSGRRRGLAAGFWRAVLRCGEMPYSAAVVWRNRRFDRGRRAVGRVAVPVISVGNLTVGGTGKSPLVLWLAQWIRSRGQRVAIISRGYGAESGSRNDEALELERKLPDVPHLQNPDRIAAAETAMVELESQVILLDDAFQHRRLHRDLDIVLVDALQPFGFGHLLPRGLLREPLSSLSRADVIALSRADLVGQPERDRTIKSIRTHAPHALLVEVRHEPQKWYRTSGVQQSLETLAGHRVAAFCGIGNPEGFQRTLEQCGVQLAGFRVFPDHYPFRRDDVEMLTAWAQQIEATDVVCTGKDLVKIQVERLGPVPLWALEIGIAFASGQALLETLLERCCHGEAAT